jgi:hypothetical protein
MGAGESVEFAVSQYVGSYVRTYVNITIRSSSIRFVFNSTLAVLVAVQTDEPLDGIYSLQHRTLDGSHLSGSPCKSSNHGSHIPSH